jgi:hypothetical protein
MSNQKRMDSKTRMLDRLREEFTRWEELLDGLSEKQITFREGPSASSIKDEIAHLRAWQQISIARLEAAALGSEPDFPEWLEGSDPEDEQKIDSYNARIFDAYRDRSWSQVHGEWKEGFLRFLEVGSAIPYDAMVDAEKFPWLKGYPLLAVLQGSYEHHKEHRESVSGWLHTNRKN